MQVAATVRERCLANPRGIERRSKGHRRANVWLDASPISKAISMKEATLGLRCLPELSCSMLTHASRRLGWSIGIQARRFSERIQVGTPYSPMTHVSGKSAHEREFLLRAELRLIFASAGNRRSSSIRVFTQAEPCMSGGSRCDVRGYSRA